MLSCELIQHSKLRIQNLRRMSVELLIDLKRLVNLTLKIQNLKLRRGNDLHIKEEIKQKKGEKRFSFFKESKKEEI